MNDMVYTELIKGMTWSYSRISCFNDCSYKWFLKYIHGLKEKPMFYSSYGSFMHKLLERFYKGELTKEQMKTEFLLNFQKEVKGDRPQVGTVEKYIIAAIKYLDSFEPFPYNMVDVEKRVDFKIGNKTFVGFIDFIGEKDGEYCIVDNKSRDLKPRSKRKNPTVKDKELDEMLIQLYLYAEALKQVYGKFPKWLCFNCFKSGVFIEEPFTMSGYNKAINWALENINYIENCSDFPPWIDYFPCRFLCGVQDECCYYEDGGR